MSHNTLSKSMDDIPMWIVQAVIGLIFTGALAWAVWSTEKVNSVEAKEMVSETKIDSIKEDLVEIKGMQKETNRKLDRLNEKVWR